MKAAGALAPTHQNSSPATPMLSAVLAQGGSSGGFSSLTTGTDAAAAGLGAAETAMGGGGQVIVPSLMTVAPRTISSSMLTVMLPSFSLQSSSSNRNRLVAYRVEDWRARRLGRSV